MTEGSVRADRTAVVRGGSQQRNGAHRSKGSPGMRRRRITVPGRHLAAQQQARQRNEGYKGEPRCDRYSVAGNEPEIRTSPWRSSIHSKRSHRCSCGSHSLDRGYSDEKKANGAKFLSCKNNILNNIA